MSHKYLILICIFCFYTVSYSQVGIDETNPSQKLDIKGKIEVGDDALPATEGAIRYNATDQDFEGYNGNQWNSFTMNRGMLPEGAIPCYSRISIPTDGTYTTFTIREMALNNNPFTTVPTGKYFIVTGASFHGSSSGATVNTNYTIRISGSTNPTDEVIWLRGRHEQGLQSAWTNGAVPLIILKPDEYLRAQHPNYVGDETTVYVYIRGWLVDNLGY